MTKKPEAKKKKRIDGPNIPKMPTPKAHPVLILFVIAFAVALLATNLKQGQLYQDDPVGLNVLEQNYLLGAYKTIEINENKATAELT